MDDLISRQAAIEEVRKMAIALYGYDATSVISCAIYKLQNLPSAQPEPAIPLQWIEAQIEWLKSLDNAFSALTAVQISAMVNKWKDEHGG